MGDLLADCGGQRHPHHPTREVPFHPPSDHPMGHEGFCARWNSWRRGATVLEISSCVYRTCHSPNPLLVSSNGIRPRVDLTRGLRESENDLREPGPRLVRGILA